MVEIDRPDRKTRLWRGKSDPVDAEAAARAALAERRTGAPKFRDGGVEALRALRVARRSAVQQRADSARQIKNLIVTAPAGVRTMLRHLKDKDLFAICAGFRPSLDQAGDPVTATKIALPPTGAATGPRMRPSTGSFSAACAGTSAPVPTWNDGPKRACRRKRSSAASSGSSPARSTKSFSHPALHATGRATHHHSMMLPIAACRDGLRSQSVSPERTHPWRDR
ncbi:hypothetical protein AB0D54_21530 [Streptomyces xanthophaeus]|uniref:IS110 family transposase n=1 Tax=Streptomyces xanthophaeus TaxID=67385 RepID=UPI00343F75FC